MEQGEIVNIIIDTINTILGNIISSIDNSMYSSLDSVIFIGPDIIKNSSFEKLLGANGKYGLIYLADAMLLFLCFIVLNFFMLIMLKLILKNLASLFLSLLFLLF